MAHYKFIERGVTPEGIHFCILENSRGKQVVSIDIETVWKVQTRKQQRNAPTTTHVGGTAYHKRHSKIRRAG